MKARWEGTCAKCDTTWTAGENIKPWFRRTGFDPGGKPIYTRVPKRYVHVKCPKVTPNRPGQHPLPNVDPLTGEILRPESSPIPRHTVEQRSLFA